MQIFAKVLNYINNLTQNNLFLNISNAKTTKKRVYFHTPAKLCFNSFL